MIVKGKSVFLLDMDTNVRKTFFITSDFFGDDIFLLPYMDTFFILITIANNPEIIKFLEKKF